MSIQEARRAAFEGAVIELAKDSPMGVHPGLLLRFEEGDYKTSWVYAAWWAWNAALDSVCVVFPSQLDHTGCGNAIDRCAEAIEAAGIRCEVAK